MRLNNVNTLYFTPYIIYYTPTTHIYQIDYDVIIN